MDLDEVFGGVDEAVASRLRKTLHRAESEDTVYKGYDFFNMNDIPMPEEKGVFGADPDSGGEPGTSAFAKAHQPEAVSAMHRESWTHQPREQPQRVEKFMRSSATELKKFSLLDYLKRSKLKGAELRALIAGCDRSVQSELLEIAETEGLI